MQSQYYLTKESIMPSRMGSLFRSKISFYHTLKEIYCNFLYQFRVWFLHEPDAENRAKLRAFIKKYRIDSQRPME